MPVSHNVKIRNCYLNAYTYKLYIVVNVKNKKWPLLKAAIWAVALIAYVRFWLICLFKIDVKICDFFWIIRT